MSLESTITGILAAATAVTDIVGAKIYAGHAPQQTAAPYLVWAIIDSGQIEDHDTGADRAVLSDSLISVSAYGATYEQAVALSAAARAAIEGSSIVFTIETPRRDARDDALQIYRRDFDFTAWASE